MDFGAFRLDDPALQDVRRALEARIREGLAAENQEIKALPAWIAPPEPDVHGKAIVVDTGGTNMRATLIDLGSDRTHTIGEAPSNVVPRGDDRVVLAEEFFRLQAELVRDLAPPHDLPVGYCFSYPATAHDDGDATLIRWTKNIRIRDVEGRRVGAPLRKALEALGLHPGPVRVLNDTVSTMLAGAWLHHDPRFPETIGLIAGTGTNMATFLARDAITKLDEVSTPQASRRRMAVNLESGNFHPPHLTRWDDALDAQSIDPGRQRFEKAVSGYWLPFLFQAALPDSKAIDPERGTGPLAALARDARASEERELAALLLQRSADLIAAAICGLCDVLPAGNGVTVIAEGSLFWKSEGYADRVRTTVTRLLDGARTVRVERVEDANFVGSACAALARARR